MTYARHQFMLSEPQEDGRSLFEHLRSMKGEPHELIANAPVLPESLVPLWDDYLDLHSSRESNGWGPRRISRADIREYAEEEGFAFDPWQRKAIRKADNAWLAEFAPKPKEGAQ